MDRKRPRNARTRAHCCVLPEVEDDKTQSDTESTMDDSTVSERITERERGLKKAIALIPPRTDIHIQQCENYEHFCSLSTNDPLPPSDDIETWKNHLDIDWIDCQFRLSREIIPIVVNLLGPKLALADKKFSGKLQPNEENKWLQVTQHPFSIRVSADESNVEEKRQRIIHRMNENDERSIIRNIDSPFVLCNAVEQYSCAGLLEILYSRGFQRIRVTGYGMKTKLKDFDVENWNAVLATYQFGQHGFFNSFDIGYSNRGDTVFGFDMSSGTYGHHTIDTFPTMGPIFGEETFGETISVRDTTLPSRLIPCTNRYTKIYNLWTHTAKQATKCNFKEPIKGKRLNRYIDICDNAVELYMEEGVRSSLGGMRIECRFEALNVENAFHMFVECQCYNPFWVFTIADPAAKLNFVAVGEVLPRIKHFLHLARDRFYGTNPEQRNRALQDFEKRMAGDLAHIIGISHNGYYPLRGTAPGADFKWWELNHRNVDGLAAARAVRKNDERQHEPIQSRVNLRRDRNLPQNRCLRPLDPRRKITPPGIKYGDLNREETGWTEEDDRELLDIGNKLPCSSSDLPGVVAWRRVMEQWQGRLSTAEEMYDRYRELKKGRKRERDR